MVTAEPRLQTKNHVTLQKAHGERQERETHLSDRSRERLLSKEAWRLGCRLDSEADSASLRPLAADSTLPYRLPEARDGGEEGKGQHTKSGRHDKPPAGLFLPTPFLENWHDGVLEKLRRTCILISAQSLSALGDLWANCYPSPSLAHLAGLLRGSHWERNPACCPELLLQIHNNKYYY